jgi:hypothetical protein
MQEHNVQLPDEYDQIWHDIEPFWGLDPIELQRLQLEQEALPESFTIGKAGNAPIAVLNESLSNPDLLRASQGILPLLKPVEKDIPPFRAVISPHDNPYAFFDYNVKQAALEAARSDKREFVCSNIVSYESLSFRFEGKRFTANKRPRMDDSLSRSPASPKAKSKGNHR